MFLTEPMAVSVSDPNHVTYLVDHSQYSSSGQCLALLGQQDRLTGGQGDSNDPFDDTVETPDMEDIVPTVTWPHIWPTFTSCFLGRGEHLFRTQNLLHCLGSALPSVVQIKVYYPGRTQVQRRFSSLKSL